VNLDVLGYGQEPVQITNEAPEYGRTLMVWIDPLVCTNTQ
jgi:hypothetical protein